eukprot:scaffold24884_cov67-Phaeocystis_antarctica.AAC.2
MELHGRGGVCGAVRAGGVCGKGRPSVLSMKERLVILVGFYPTRSARFLIARGVGCGVVGGEEAWTACVAGRCRQVRRIGECVTWKA